MPANASDDEPNRPSVELIADQTEDLLESVRASNHELDTYISETTELIEQSERLLRSVSVESTRRSRHRGLSVRRCPKHLAKLDALGEALVKEQADLEAVSKYIRTLPAGHPHICVHHDASTD